MNSGDRLDKGKPSCIEREFRGGWLCRSVELSNIRLWVLRFVGPWEKRFEAFLNVNYTGVQYFL